LKAELHSNAGFENAFSHKAIHIDDSLTGFFGYVSEARGESRSRSRRLLKAPSGLAVFSVMFYKEPRLSNAARWNAGVRMSHTPWLECWSSGFTRRGRF
jgi:hypothetical protein